MFDQWSYFHEKRMTTSTTSQVS